MGFSLGSALAPLTGGTSSLVPDQDLSTAGSIALSAIPGVGQYLGNKEANASNIAMQNSANATNIQLARENTAFQERMSNSAHQREIADLKAAGLNPIMSASSGGSSTPSGSVANVGAAKVSSNAAGVSEAVQGAIGAAMGIMQTNSQIDVNKAKIAESGSSTAKNLASAGVDKATVQQIGETIKQMQQSIKESDARTRSTLAELPKKQVQNKGYDLANKVLENIQSKADPYIDHSDDNFKTRIQKHLKSMWGF